MKYYFKKQGNKFSSDYVANKFSDGGEFLESYDIVSGDCNCWAHRRNPPCKHLKMLAMWLRQEEPLKVWFNDTTKRFEPNPYADTSALDNYMETEDD